MIKFGKESFGDDNALDSALDNNSQHYFEFILT